MTAAPEVECTAFADVEGAVHALRARGLRLSTSRRLILQALFAAEEPVSADRLARTLELELTSVYRNLETLERHGLVHHVHLGHGAGLYALVGRGEREYLYCERCGAVRARSSRASSIRCSAIVSELFGFETRFTHFALPGDLRGVLIGGQWSRPLAGQHHPELRRERSPPPRRRARPPWALRRAPSHRQLAPGAGDRGHARGRPPSGGRPQLVRSTRGRVSSVSSPNGRLAPADEDRRGQDLLDVGRPSHRLPRGQPARRHRRLPVGDPAVARRQPLGQKHAQARPLEPGRDRLEQPPVLEHAARQDDRARCRLPRPRRGARLHRRRGQRRRETGPRPIPAGRPGVDVAERPRRSPRGGRSSANPSSSMTSIGYPPALGRDRTRPRARSPPGPRS